MADIRKVKKLIELVKETAIAGLEIQEKDEIIKISNFNPTVATEITVPKTIAPPPNNGDSAKDSSKSADIKPKHTVNSPMVGTVYLTSAPGANPFVTVGQTVKVGDALCLVEAMKMFNRIDTDRAGIVKAILVENGQPVEYDQPLFVIE